VTRLPVLAGTLAFPIVSCVFAGTYGALRPGFRADDLWFALFWSALPCPGIYFVLRIFDRRTAAVGAPRAYSVAALAGILTGAAWVLCMVLVFDGWLANVPYPVILIWLAGSMAAFAVCSVCRRPASWWAAVLVVVVPVFIAYGVLRAASVQPPDIVVELASDATQADMDKVWDAIRANEGTAALYRWDSDRCPRVGVSFHPGTSLKRRAEIVASIRAVPLVTQVTDAEVTPPGQAKGQWKDLK